MAAKMKKPTMILRKIAKPVISSDIMGNRNVEVRAVGAWVQAEPVSHEPEAVHAAREEEMRLRKLQQEKQARLRHFQQEVKKRVKQLDQVKKQQQLETNYHASEHERNIVTQSGFSSDDYAKKDSCLIRPLSALSVSKTGSGVGDQEGDGCDNEETERGKAFSDQTNQVHEHVRHAKRNLVSRRVITDQFLPDDLPGGVWRVSSTRDDDWGTSHPVSRHTDDANLVDLEDDVAIEGVKVVNNKVYQNDMENVAPATEKVVQFDLEPQKDETRQERIERRSQSASTIHGTDVHRAPRSVRVPDIYAGVTGEEERRRARSQQAMYRRLFMDIEREQVKENLRRQEHRKRIQRLKKEKEEVRAREEQISQQLIEPRDPVTGETSIEVLERQVQERQFIRETILQHERRVRKSKEIERYIEALRQQLKEKVHRKKIELPPLCCCGTSLWDTNPETCANNCVFYKNPKEYGRALQAMLDSSELMVY